MDFGPDLPPDGTGHSGRIGLPKRLETPASMRVMNAGPHGPPKSERRYTGGELRFAASGPDATSIAMPGTHVRKHGETFETHHRGQIVLNDLGSKGGSPKSSAP
jgi:hypothetical protein